MRMRPGMKHSLLMGLCLLVVAGAGMYANEYHVYVLTLIVIAALPAIGLDVLMGYAGFVSVGQGAMAGAGAYAMGYCTVKFELDPWLSLVLAIVLTSLICLGLGIIVFRTSGLYFAIVTLGIALVFSGIFVNWTSVTGGGAGLVGIPRLQRVPFVESQTLSDSDFLVVSLVLLWFVYSCALAFVNSKLGLRCLAIREDPVLSRSLGIQMFVARLGAFVFAGTCAAVGGALFASSSSFIAPPSFSLLAVGFQAIAIVVVGGKGTLWGCLLGAVALTGLPEILRVTSTYSALIYAVVLLLIVLFLPKGLSGVFLAAFRRFSPRGSARAEVVSYE